MTKKLTRLHPLLPTAFLGYTLLALSALITAPAYAGNAAQCSQKLYNTLFQRPPTQDELKSPFPLAQLPAMLRSNSFRDVFARFVNAKMNTGPSNKLDDNIIYTLVKNHVLRGDKPWHELFNGQVSASGSIISEDANAIGYFENANWKQRYAGNEEDGYRLRSAYLIINNVIGLNLDAITVTSTGGSARNDRKNPQSVCYSCHYASEFALDKIANILTKVDREASANGSIVFTPEPEGPNQTLFNTNVSNLSDLVNTLIAQDQFNTQACSLAFEFLFARQEGGTEPALMNQCISQFKQSQKITDAVALFVQSPIFCSNGGRD